MDLNRETAMRLWNKSFGKETKVKDFAGRTIAKGAYNDRNSEFGWNVDHILPRSKGGATADHNLVCCHIKTNDEKSDIFPCFKSNGISFEIIKVQNHYEIRTKDKKKESNDSYGSNELDFFDSAAGVRCFKKMQDAQNKKRFVGTVFVKLFGVTNTVVLDFIKQLLNESLTFKRESLYVGREEWTAIAHNYDMPLKDDTEELLDKCVLLNTYLSKYFEPCKYVEGFDIYYRVDFYANAQEMYIKHTDEVFKKRGRKQLVFSPVYKPYKNSLFVNDIVLENTHISEKVKQTNDEYTEYNFVYTKLAENLNREAIGK